MVVVLLSSLLLGFSIVIMGFPWFPSLHMVGIWLAYLSNIINIIWCNSWLSPTCMASNSSCESRAIFS